MSGNPVTSRMRPKTSGSYLAASAAWRAGFRGWPLVIMTAIAGQQSGWNPTSLNNNPSTGDYSVGLWQINYFGNLLNSRTQQYGPPSSLISNPQDQANAAYQLAGGNELVGLSNWALAASPRSGSIPTPESGGASIAPFIPEAMSAASEVGTFGPASASQIAQASAWPGSTPLGSAINNTGGTKLNPKAQAIIDAAVSAPGCSKKPPIFKTGGVLGVGSFQITACQAKAITGGFMVVSGGLFLLIGMASLIVGSFGGRSSGAAAIAPVILVARAGGRGVRAVRPRRRAPGSGGNEESSESVSEPAEEAA